MRSDELLVLFGTEEAPPEMRVLRAGALCVELSNGNLRKVRFGDIEIVRGIAFLVRDKDWGTAETQVTRLSLSEHAEAFRVDLAARCEVAGARFDYCATIEGSSAGILAFRAIGSADRDLETNRTGFVVLHPLDGVVGRPMHVTHTDGRSETVVMPELVSADLLVQDIAALRHEPVDGLSIVIKMTGDAYEMEDQRNWTDASLKTFVRPLSKPHPYILNAGERIEQSVELKVVADTHGSVRGTDQGHLNINDGIARGQMPAIGLRIDSRDLAETRRISAAISYLGPQELTTRFEPGDPHAHEALELTGALARDVGAEVALELVVAGDPDGTASDLASLADAAQKVDLNISALLPSPRRDLKVRAPRNVPDGELALPKILAAARKAFPGPAIGGGVLVSFAEFNANPPPANEINFFAHGTSAIVHAADDEAVMETLAALPHVARTVRDRGRGQRYRLGPSSIGLRENPSGAETAPNLSGRRIPSARFDPRHRALFGAAWTLGYWAAAALHDVDVLTLADAAGDFGVAEILPSGQLRLHPLFHVLRGAARAAGRPRRNVGAPPTVAAVTWENNGEIEIWLANLTCAEKALCLPNEVSRIAILDQITVDAASADPSFLDRVRDHHDQICLGPFAVARLTS